MGFAQRDKIAVAPFPSWETEDRLPQEKTSPRTKPRAWSLPPPKEGSNEIKFLEMRSAPSRALRTFSTVLPYA
jgi:hypothetical protein